MTGSTHFWCDTCNVQSLLIIDGRSIFRDEYEEEIVSQMGHCVRCSQPGLVIQQQVGPDEWSHFQLYPKILKKTDLVLPPRVNESFREAVLCESAGAWLATAVMVRRTLEAIAKEIDPSAKTLMNGLEALKKKGLISDELHQWGTELRFIGNIGAHPTGDVIERQDANDAMEFLKAIVETIYHLRPKFQEMQRRRKKAKELPAPVVPPTE
jgi:hypothetical protein